MKILPIQLEFFMNQQPRSQNEVNLQSSVLWKSIIESLARFEKLILSIVLDVVRGTGLTFLQRYFMFERSDAHFVTANTNFEDNFLGIGLTRIEKITSRSQKAYFKYIFECSRRNESQFSGSLKHVREKRCTLRDIPRTRFFWYLPNLAEWIFRE